MKAITLGLAPFLLVGLAAAYGADKKDDNKTKIVGVWEAVKGDALPKGAIVEFTKDGKLNVAFEREGTKEKIEGTYEVDGDMVKSKHKLPDGTEKKLILKINKLSDKELVVKGDEDGKEVEFKRVEKPKDKDK